MIWGLAGASGTGKTTLGKRVGDALGIPFIPTSITDMARECGYEAIGDLNLTDRIVLQTRMLDLFSKKLNAIEGHAILDRTPADMIGYLMAEIYMHSGEELNQDFCQLAADYPKACLALTKLHFDHVFITTPLPFYTEASNRPKLNPAYQLHVQLLIEGAIYGDNTHKVGYSKFLTTDLEARSSYMIEMIGRRIEANTQMRRSSRHIH